MLACRKAPARICVRHSAHHRVHTAVLDTSPRAAAPSIRQSDHKPCFVFQSPLTTATMAQKITQVRCRCCRSERHSPSLGSAPRPPAHQPRGMQGTAAVPRNNPPPSADGIPLPGGPTGDAASCVQELASGGAGGRQGSPEALPHRPHRGRLTSFPELPECERGEFALQACQACSASVGSMGSVLCECAKCALRACPNCTWAMPFAPRPGPIPAIARG